MNYRYVGEELLYLLRDAQAKVLIYGSEFAPQVDSIRKELPDLGILIQVSDDSGRPLLDGAIDYDTVVNTPPPVMPAPTPSGEDLFLIYTGGTTGMPKVSCGANMTSSCPRWGAHRWAAAKR